MPKTKARKKGTGNARSAQTTGSVPATAAQPIKQPVPTQQTLMSLLMSAMVMLGCWGFAISFIFLTNDPDRYALGTLAILLALTWSAYFGIRLRKWLQRR